MDFFSIIGMDRFELHFGIFFDKRLANPRSNDLRIALTFLPRRRFRLARHEVHRRTHDPRGFLLESHTTKHARETRACESTKFKDSSKKMILHEDGTIERGTPLAGDEIRNDEGENLSFDVRNFQLK